jgi:hypothetical protein
MHAPTSLEVATRWIVLTGLVALAGIIFVELLTGRINTRYLLHGLRRDGTRYVSPERIQLLIATLTMALTYLGESVATGHRGRLPDIPESWLVGLGGSQSIYLGGKALRLLRFGHE